MGMDFVALMKSRGPDARLADALSFLQRDSLEELRVARDLMDTLGFRCRNRNPAGWETTDGNSLGLDFQPNLPDVAVSWWTPEEFSLSFGTDTIQVYHLLRWHSFLTDSRMQEAMLKACAALGRLFGVTDCIVTSDYNPTNSAFLNGMTFNAALQEAEPEYGEVANLEDLYLSYFDESDIAAIPTGNDLIPWQLVLTRRDKPLPDGWQRVDRTWDSFGYWRFRWSPEIGADHPWPPVPKRSLSSSIEERPQGEVDPEALEGLLHDLRYEVRRKQEKAADTLRELGPAAKAAVPDLVEALGKRWPAVRKRVALALGHVGGGAEVIPALQRVLEQDEDADVRHAAADTLIRLGAGVSLLHSTDDERRRQASEGLAELGPAARSAVPALLAMLLDNDPITSLNTRRSLARAIWLIGPDANVLPDLLRALQAPDELVRLWIARSFAILGPAAVSATPALVQALTDPAEMVRSSLAWALARIGLDAIGSVVKALQSGKPALRRGAAECLGRMRAHDAIPFLKAAQQDNEEAVRRAATESLRRLAMPGRA
jgi:HEAT repeat protein